MKKAKHDAIVIARHIHTFLHEYVPSQKSRSDHTLRSYECALSLYIGFLENENDISPGQLNCECFSRDTIEAWLYWLSEGRNCSPETCNNRLASLRAFLKYLGEKDISMLHVYEAASRIQSNVNNFSEFKNELSHYDGI